MRSTDVRRRHLAVVVAIALVTLAGAACSSSAPADLARAQTSGTLLLSEKVAPNPCTLVTTAQLTAAIGIPIDPRPLPNAPNYPDGARQCFMSSGQGPGSVSVTIDMVTQAALDATDHYPRSAKLASLENIYDAAGVDNKSSHPQDGPSQPVHGIGTKAKGWEATIPGETPIYYLAVLTSRVEVVLSVDNGPTIPHGVYNALPDLAQMVAAARLILASPRLPSTTK